MIFKCCSVQQLWQYNLVYIRECCLFSAGNKRDYGPVDRPFVKIGRGIVFSALFAIVKGSCSVQTNDSQIEKAIREGINTLRLHDTQVKMRELKKQIADLPNHHEDTCEPEFIESPRNSGDEDSFQ